MRVAERLEKRWQDWRELESLCHQMEARSRQPADVHLRFASLYRSACADLALADSYQLPQHTVQYLHQLVARAHNQFYKSRQFKLTGLFDEIAVKLPRRLFQDGCLRLTFVLFWGVFLASMWQAARSRDWAETALGAEHLEMMTQMYDQKFTDWSVVERSGMAGFYLGHNSGIGMRCFVTSAFVVGLVEMLHNAYVLGATFGFMSTVPQRDTFFEFVTAHGPFELTAIVLASAAGLRLGWAVVSTLGRSRPASLKSASKNALPTAVLAVILFGLAALIEAYVSPSPAPYWIKAVVAGVSSGTLLFYFVFLGYPRESPGT